MDESASSTALTVRIRHHELLIRRRYETLGITNDFLIALWFVIGSILFFWNSTSELGVWFFLAGSVELAIRPVIRLSRHVHLRRLPSTSETEF